MFKMIMTSIETGVSVEYDFDTIDAAQSYIEKSMNGPHADMIKFELAPLDGVACDSFVLQDAKLCFFANTEDKVTVNHMNAIIDSINKESEKCLYIASRIGINGASFYEASQYLIFCINYWKMRLKVLHC